MPSPQDETNFGLDPETSSESQAEAPPSSKAEDAPFPSKLEGSSPSISASEQSSQSSAQASKQIYPLYPSITQLLHENGISVSEADKIPASGPKGRLLKGDVLAYLGTISKAYPSEQSNRISKLGHLDLSNIKVAPPKEMPDSDLRNTISKDPSPQAELDPNTEVAVTISLSSVLEVQKRVQATLGITLPLSTFISRATEVANDDLPRSSVSGPTADELFNSVLGLDKVGSKVSRGSFTPQITALPPTLEAHGKISRGAIKEPDIIDVLTGQLSGTARKEVPRGTPLMKAVPTLETPASVFSVVTPKGDERRAKVFLERMKTMLQVEPGRRTCSSTPDCRLPFVFGIIRVISCRGAQERISQRSLPQM